MQQTETDSTIKHTILFIMTSSKFISLDYLSIANEKNIEIIQ